MASIRFHCHNNEFLFHQKIELHILCYNNTEDKNYDKSIYIYINIKTVCHYNKWSLKINLFTKLFIKRSALMFGRAQSFS